MGFTDQRPGAVYLAAAARAVPQPERHPGILIDGHDVQDADDKSIC
ncbi:hypothetical protein ACLB1N_31385 [Escherichia coli]